MSRRLIARVCALSALLLAALLILVLDGHGVSWLAGVLAGAGAGGWVALGRRGASSVRHRLPVVRAERRTEQALAALEPAGWRFAHQLRGTDGIYDHVAVGLGGLIVLQSMGPEGSVTMRGGEPILEVRATPDAEPIPQRLRPRAVADAASLRDDLERVCGTRTWVQAVVVFWCDFPAGTVVDGRCVYIHGSRLAEWLGRRPHQYDERAAADVFSAVQELARAGGELPLSLAV